MEYTILKFRPLHNSIDDRDRKVLATGCVLMVVAVLTILLIAATLGLAIRVFLLTAYGG